MRPHLRRGCFGSSSDRTRPVQAEHEAPARSPHRLKRSDRHLDLFHNRSQRRAVRIVIRQDLSAALETFNMPFRRWHLLGSPCAIVLVIIEVEEHLTRQFFAVVFRDIAELIVDVGNSPALVRCCNDRGLIERKFKVGEFLKGVPPFRFFVAFCRLYPLLSE